MPHVYYRLGLIKCNALGGEKIRLLAMNLIIFPILRNNSMQVAERIV
jgi:hypothetical protein